MYKDKILILLIFLTWNSTAQSVVIDVAYQPTTAYQWSVASTHNMTGEYLGAEPMEEHLNLRGIDSYSERTDSNMIAVTMNTGEWEGQRMPYWSVINTYSRKHIGSSPITQRRRMEPLEIDDVLICGVVNRFQKIEIDSINGVDSLYEKNRFFAILDNVHRSLKYPKDALEIGKPIL